jgi:hypothetical protein
MCRCAERREIARSAARAFVSGRRQDGVAEAARFAASMKADIRALAAKMIEIQGRPSPKPR